MTEPSKSLKVKYVKSYGIIDKDKSESCVLCLNNHYGFK